MVHAEVVTFSSSALLVYLWYVAAGHSGLVTFLSGISVIFPLEGFFACLPVFSSVPVWICAFHCLLGYFSISSFV